MKKFFKREIFFFLLLICAKPSFCEIDSDNDGMPDDWELFYNLDIYSDDSFSENDSDYFYNLNEYFFQTNPTNPDTDNDGLLDGEEVQYIDDPFLYSAENGIYCQLFPAVCSNGTDYLLTWVDYGYNPPDSENSSEIIGIILDGAGNPKTWEFMINTNIVERQDVPQVCSNGGKYLVVWVDGNPGSPLEGKGMDIAGQFIDSSGSKIGSEFQINSYTTGDQCACCAVPIGDNFLVVWVNNLPGDIKTEIQGQIIDQNGQKIGQEININSYHAEKQEMPAVASNGQRCLVAWSSFADGQWDVYAQILDNEGGKIGSEFRINDYTDNDQSTPAIASDGKNFMITWKSRGQDGDVYGIYAKQIDSDGNTIKPEFRINETTQNAQMYSSICFNGRYYFIAWVDGIWYEEYGRAFFNEVRASSFDNEGRIMLHETSFRIFSDSDDYISQQWFPVIATFGSDFFIAWWNSDIEWYEDKVDYYNYIAGKMVNPGYGTDPANSDSDEDNLRDGDEI